MSGTHWATIASSVGGLATAGALLVSLFLLGQQMREQRRARTERYREHASNISFWLEISRIYHALSKVVVTAHIENTSARPAMEILLLAGVRNDIWHAVSAGRNTKLDEQVAQWSTVAVGPQSKVERLVDVELPRPVIQLVDQYKNDVIIGELHFTDAAGFGWVRTSDGQLIESKSALWISMIPLSLSQRDAQRRQALAPRRGIRQRFLHWAISHLS
jgi:hypothetical protein